MVLKSVFVLDKTMVHELAIKFVDNNGVKLNRHHSLRININSSPEQVACDLEELASTIRRDEELK